MWQNRAKNTAVIILQELIFKLSSSHECQGICERPKFAKKKTYMVTAILKAMGTDIFS